MEDYLVKIITDEVNVRAIACTTANLVNEACQRHKTSPTGSAALGRVLTAGCLMGALLKSGQRVAIKFEGNGPIKKIIAEADSEGHVRGYVGVPEADVPLKDGKFDVAGLIGKAGILTVTKDLQLKEPYTGVVHLVSGEIAEDLAFYFAESEQIPSAVGLGVFVEKDGNVSASGGFLIQSFPPQNEKTIETLITRINQLPPITELLRQGKRPEDILEAIFSGIPFQILETKELYFKCSCNIQRVEEALISLGRNQILKLLEEEGAAEIKCEFCRQTYLLPRDKLEKLIEELNAPKH